MMTEILEGPLGRTQGRDRRLAPLGVEEGGRGANRGGDKERGEVGRKRKGEFSVCANLPRAGEDA